MLCPSTVNSILCDRWSHSYGDRSESGYQSTYSYRFADREANVSLAAWSEERYGPSTSSLTLLPGDNEWSFGDAGPLAVVVLARENYSMSSLSDGR
jgi:hypothetical protein